LQVDEVTGNAFAFLGVPALLGRGLIAEDAPPGAPSVFAMAHHDANILGRSFDGLTIISTWTQRVQTRFKMGPGPIITNRSELFVRTGR